MNVMIIDDDENVCQRLKSMIDWDGLGLTLACEARDSETAMELYMLHRPKIIITDINIPVISGLDLAEILQKEDPELCFVVITAYNDLEHTQKAFGINTISLLCKPIRHDEIHKALEKCISQITSHRERWLSVSALQQIVERNLPAVQQNYMEKLLREKPEDESLVQHKLNQLKLEFSGTQFVVALITLRVKEEQEENLEAMLFLARDMLAERLERAGCSIYAFVDTNVRLNCICSATQGAVEDLVENAITQIQEQMAYSSKVRIFAGIGQQVSRIEDLHESYGNARIALKYQGVFGEDHIIQYKNMERSELAVHTQDAACTNLVNQFRDYDLPAMEQTLQKQVAALEMNPQDGRRLVRNFLLEATTSLLSEAMRLGLEIGNTETLIDIYSGILKSEQPGSRGQDLLALAKAWMDQLEDRRDSGTAYLVRQAKEFIKNNLHDETIDLEQVSNHVGLSRIYFCKLFHQRTGVNFISYLKNERIEFAKQMLVNSDKKVNEISQEAGFSSPRYFSYVFKQTVGLTPLEYQKQGKTALSAKAEV